jgi:Dehydrogenases with different specificities (related to short-chain alcohol dehydrogenases)
VRASELFDVSGEISLVTGGASGIGFKMARALAENGARVLIADVDRHAVAAAQAALSGLPGRVTGHVADVTDEAAIAAVFDAAGAEAGPVTVLVNNAGIVHRDKAAKLSRATLRKVLDVNLEGAFLVAQEAARRLISAGRGGSIVNISSILASQPVRQVVAYGMAKAAMSQMTRTLALEWARHGIRVNEIRPGWFDTPLTERFLDGSAGAILSGQTPMKRLGAETDLDGALLFLASKASAYVTGASITVDGGHSLGR